MIKSFNALKILDHLLINNFFTMEKIAKSNIGLKKEEFSGISMMICKKKLL